jgi:hypothetical protein
VPVGRNFGRVTRRPGTAATVAAVADVSYLVFFARDPVDDRLAGAIVERVRACPGAGWFDDPAAASPAERTTGGYVRASAIDEPVAAGLLDVARSVSADHAIVVEVQWREAVLGVLEAGAWRPSTAAP